MGASPGMPDGPVLCQPPPLPDASPTVEGGATRQRPERPKIGRKVQCVQLKDALGTDQIAQGVRTKVAEGAARRQTLANQSSRGSRKDDLAAMGAIQES